MPFCQYETMPWIDAHPRHSGLYGDYQFMNKEAMTRWCMVVLVWVASSRYWFIYPNSALKFGLKVQPAPANARFWSKPDWPPAGVELARTNTSSQVIRLRRGSNSSGCMKRQLSRPEADVAVVAGQEIGFEQYPVGERPEVRRQHIAETRPQILLLDGSLTHVLRGQVGVARPNRGSVAEGIADGGAEQSLIPMIPIVIPAGLHLQPEPYLFQARVQRLQVALADGLQPSAAILQQVICHRGRGMNRCIT